VASKFDGRADVTDQNKKNNSNGNQQETNKTKISRQ
jgi:hypothetical protein